MTYHGARPGAALALYHHAAHPQAWMLDAACSPDPAWTADHKPPTGILIELRNICADCPVIRDCAGYALDNAVHGGMWAGVWLPHRTSSTWWDARTALHRKTQPLTATKGAQ